MWPPTATWWRASRFLQSGMWMSACNSPISNSRTSRTILNPSAYWSLSSTCAGELLVEIGHETSRLLPSVAWWILSCPLLSMPWIRALFLASNSTTLRTFLLQAKPFVHAGADGSLLNKHPLHWTKKLKTSTYNTHFKFAYFYFLLTHLELKR